MKLLLLVNSDPVFGEQPAVANGASDLLVEVFGPERGPHARSAIEAYRVALTKPEGWDRARAMRPPVVAPGTLFTRAQVAPLLVD